MALEMLEGEVAESLYINLWTPKVWARCFMLWKLRRHQFSWKGPSIQVPRSWHTPPLLHLLKAGWLATVNTELDSLSNSTLTLLSQGRKEQGCRSEDLGSAVWPETNWGTSSIFTLRQTFKWGWHFLLGMTKEVLKMKEHLKSPGTQ